MKPILFNTEMVRAILEGRKTVTRRVVKTQHKDACGFYVTTRKSDGAFMGVYDYDDAESMYGSPQTPPYKVNDVLYVRETWRELIRPVGAPREFDYKADRDAKFLGLFKWKPSIHMPKEAARIFLRVTGVRVERLKDITNEQILLEGVDKKQIENTLSQMPEPVDEWERGCYVFEWANLWDSTVRDINHSWSGNPFVWVIEFERITKEQAYELDRQQS